MSGGESSVLFALVLMVGTVKNTDRIEVRTEMPGEVVELPGEEITAVKRRNEKCNALHAVKSPLFAVSRRLPKKLRGDLSAADLERPEVHAPLKVFE
ncbi:MAG: hypothetical protein APF80_08465 [Alphaproteobacteria bacterium BRH_c36]|nr:MAG: hypothetical protein APF80_08465 [Alphaproteobacteria bacterium BRH_c36]